MNITIGTSRAACWPRAALQCAVRMLCCQLVPSLPIVLLAKFLTEAASSRVSRVVRTTLKRAYQSGTSNMTLSYRRRCVTINHNHVVTASDEAPETFLRRQRSTRKVHLSGGAMSWRLKEP